MLEHVGHIPSMKYVPGNEIQDHALALAEKDKLREKALFQTEVNAITWSEETGRWHATTTRGDKIRARFIVSAIGILHKLHLPGIPGVEEFEGHTFHTSRWDYEYTGGDRYGAPLSKLRGKRVGLVGTGASTLQVLPHLGASGAETFVFQRTPTAVDQRINPKTDEAWFKSLKPGWQDERADNFEQVFFGANPGIDMVNDGWTKHTYALHAEKDGDKTFQDRLKAADNLKMEEVRQRTARIVKDPVTAEGLKAWYGRTCKRPGFHNDYLPTFNLPNVHLVNTDGKGVERVTPKGVIAAGQETELDCIIYATGFDWGNDYSARANMAITGRNGKVMSDKWNNGPSTLHGMIGRDFPNLLIFTHLQSSTSPNYTHLLSERSKHAAYIIAEALKRNAKAVEPTQDAEDAWVKRLEDIAMQYLDHFQQCTPGEEFLHTCFLARGEENVLTLRKGYLNSEGGLSAKNLRNASVGLTGPEWYSLAKDWRSTGKLEGLELTAW